MKNRMRELRSFGSVRGEGGNVLAYSEVDSPRGHSGDFFTEETVGNFNSLADNFALHLLNHVFGGPSLGNLKAVVGDIPSLKAIHNCHSNLAEMEFGIDCTLTGHGGGFMEPPEALSMHAFACAHKTNELVLPRLDTGDCNVVSPMGWHRSQLQWAFSLAGC